MNDDIAAAIPEGLRPQASDVEFDLDRHLRAIVSVKALIPEDAFTAGILGTERHGHGAVINSSGLIATIGYLVTEAESIWLHAANGQVIAGDLIAYDYETGFGLVQALGHLDVPAFEIGDVRQLKVGANAIVAGYGGREQAILANVVAKTEFVGYWEYIVDEAIYTSPPHPNWGGAALLGTDGKLYGIGSLYTQQISDGDPDTDGNMIVPINLLTDILDELLAYGQTKKPARPWLGVFATDSDQGLVIAGIYNGAPAHAADVQAGDRIIKVAGAQVHELGSFFRHIWSLGTAGTTVPLTLERDGQMLDVEVESTDRRSHWKAPNLH